MNMQFRQAAVLRPHQVAASDALASIPWVARAHAEVTVAGGKSLIMADVARRLPGRSLILAHTKELVEQDAAACAQLGMRPAICSAALDVSVFGRVTVGTIQTVVNRLAYFEDVHSILIDEAHRIPPDEKSQYGKLLATLPRAIVRGVTGTAFRANRPDLRDTCGECVYRYPFGQALIDGYVKPLRPVPAAAAEIDTKGLQVSGGEWTGKELTNRGVKLAPAHAAAALKALAEEGRSRILVFACDIAHADALGAEFKAAGEPLTGVVHSQDGSDDRDGTVAAFRAGKLRVLISVAMFTTGFDVPDVDALVLCRPMKSKVMYVQSLGRGARLTPLASDAVLVDFGGNVTRHGPLDMLREVKPGRKRKEGENGEDDEAQEGLLLPALARSVGGDLEEAAGAAEVLRAEIRTAARWVAAPQVAMRFIYGKRYWLIATGAGWAKWFSVNSPPTPAHVFVEYNSRYGLVAHATVDGAGAMTQVN